MDKSYACLKSRVINWLKSLQVSGSFCKYKFSCFSEDNIFSSCFALFIMDLFQEVSLFNACQRQEWIEYIKSFQDKASGYFIPHVYYHVDQERIKHQLTCFCLSALKVLDSEPRYPLIFIKRWKNPEDVKNYLLAAGCHEGKAGSGNKAMFLAVFLTHEYERTKKLFLLDNIEAWFEFHDRFKNKNGFWGDKKSSHFYLGFQNGLHQLIVYFYWKRKAAFLNNSVDVILRLQDKDGFFALIPGGGGCWDYDAVHILVNAYLLSNYQKDAIAQCLKKAFQAVFTNQNDDGGFCESRQYYGGNSNPLLYLPFLFSGDSPYFWRCKAKIILGNLKNRRAKIEQGWTRNGRNWDESNLWDTWIRSLALAEISSVIALGNGFDPGNMRFHKMVGIGYLK